MPAERLGASFSRDALNVILDHSQGYPHFLQPWGETVWREAEGPKITVRDAQAAEELVDDELDRRFFRDRYEKRLRLNGSICRRWPISEMVGTHRARSQSIC